MSNLSDVVGGADLFGGSSYSFVSDRFCTKNSAIYFNKSYLQAPNGIYFSGDFTVTAWIYLKTYQSFSKFFDFGNGQESNNVFLAMIETSPKICGFTLIDSLQSLIETSAIIKLNKWYFISYVLSNKIGYIYVNGNQMTNGTLLVPKNIMRTSNYIGKSNWASNSNADAIYDEFKIYQGALSSKEIMNEFQISLDNGKLSIYFNYIIL